MVKLGDRCGQDLARLATSDERIWAIDGDLADSDGAVHFGNRHPDRFIMAGIAEQSMVSMAAGMASCGLRPWVFSFASFLSFRAYDQIRVCLSQANQPVTLVGSHSGGLTGRNGKSHAALNDLALMLGLPHLGVWAPADCADVDYAIDCVLKSPGPAYLRLPRRPVAELSGSPGVIRILYPPAETTIVSTGLGTHWAVDACRYGCRHLGTDEIGVGLLHCPRLSPFPSEELRPLLRGVRRIVVIEDHLTWGGLSTLVREVVPSIELVSIGWPAGWHGASGQDDALLQLHGLNPSQLFTKIVQRT